MQLLLSPCAVHGSAQLPCIGRGRPVPRISPRHRRFASAAPPAPPRPALTVRVSQDGGIGGFFKQAVGAIPLVGLGGIGNDEKSYGDFCRSVRETAPDDFGRACALLEKICPRAADSRYVMWVLWSAATGVGPGYAAEEVVAGAARLPVTKNLSAEIDRVEAAVEAANKKFPARRQQADWAARRAAAKAGLTRLVDRSIEPEAASRATEIEGLIGRIIAGGFPA